MRSARTLTLRKETLSRLGDTDLSKVAGGSHLGCPTHDYSCDACPIPTLPVNTCFDIYSGNIGCVVRTFDCPTLSSIDC